MKKYIAQFKEKNKEPMLISKTEIFTLINTADLLDGKCKLYDIGTFGVIEEIKVSSKRDNLTEGLYISLTSKNGNIIFDDIDLNWD